MRAYSLSILSKSGPPYIFNGGSGNNLTGLNIEFDINVFTSSYAQEIPNVIRIYNPPFALFNQGKKMVSHLSGATVLLMAGWQNTPILTYSNTVKASKNTYKQFLNYGLICQGTIQAYVPDYSDLLHPKITIAISPSQSTDLAIQQSIKLDNTTSLTALAKYIHNFVGSNVKVKIEHNVKTILATLNNNPRLISATNLTQALNKLHKIGIFCFFSQNGVLTLFAEKRALNVKSKGNNPIPTNYGAFKVVTTAPFMIHKDMIIDLPQMLNPVTLSITMCLYYKIKIGDEVYISQDVIAMLTYQQLDWINAVTTFSLQSSIMGNFIVVGVQHKGNFRSINAREWATTLLLSRIVNTTE